jgi:hypothetical protein
LLPSSSGLQNLAIAALSGAVAMGRVQTVAGFLCRLNVEAFVALKDDRIIVELTMDEYRRSEKKLRVWFEMLDANPHSIRLVERMRGYIDETAIVSTRNERMY